MARKEKVNVLLIVGAVLLCVLLLVWLFLGTTLEEDSSPVAPALLEQTQ